MNGPINNSLYYKKSNEELTMWDLLKLKSIMFWFLVRNRVDLVWLRLVSKWIRFKKSEIRLGKILFLFIILSSIWCGAVLGQYLQNRSIREEIARAYLHASDVALENGWLRSERRFLTNQITDLEVQLGIRQGKNRRQAKK